MKFITKLTQYHKKRIQFGKNQNTTVSLQLTPEQMKKAFSEDPGEGDTLEITEKQ